jgi:hypothetical protein
LITILEAILFNSFLGIQTDTIRPKKAQMVALKIVMKIKKKLKIDLPILQRRLHIGPYSA